MQTSALLVSRLGSTLLAAAIAGLLLLAVASGWYLLGGRSVKHSEPPAHLSIVALPFPNLSNDPAQDYFADGITANLTTEQGRLTPIGATGRPDGSQGQPSGIPLGATRAGARRSWRSTGTAIALFLGTGVRREEATKSLLIATAIWSGEARASPNAPSSPGTPARGGSRPTAHWRGRPALGEVCMGLLLWCPSRRIRPGSPSRCRRLHDPHHLIGGWRDVLQVPHVMRVALYASVPGWRWR